MTTLSEGRVTAPPFIPWAVAVARDGTPAPAGAPEPGPLRSGAAGRAHPGAPGGAG